MDGYLMSGSIAEMTYKKRHKAYVLYRINEHLMHYGIETLPGMLAILYQDEAGVYNSEAVRVYPHFVEKIIHGYDEYVAAYSYYNRMIRASDFSGDEITEMELLEIGFKNSKVSVYYEDNLIKTTSYYNLVMNGGIVSTESQPFEVNYNEAHPAMINMANLYSVN